jgi:hypothetical protein
MNSFRTIVMKIALMISVLSASTILAMEPKDVPAKFQEALMQNQQKQYMAAIALYEGIIDGKNVDVTSKAKAHYLMGENYLAMGNTQKAAEQFRCVINDFSEQTAFVNQADAKLVSMGLSRQKGAGKNAVPGKDPAVIQTIPALFCKNVAADMSEIRLTFNMKMKATGWSLEEFNESLNPESSVKPRFSEDGKTFIQKVKLKPSTVYKIGYNYQSTLSDLTGLPGGFKSVDGKRAKPFVLVFATASVDGKETPIPEDAIEQAREINSGSSTKMNASQTGSKSTEYVRELHGTELAHINVKKLDTLNYMPANVQAVEFDVPSEGANLKGIWIYGVLSGRENKGASLLQICEKNGNLVEEYPFSTDSFGNSGPQWVGLEVKPQITLPSTFVVKVKSKSAVSVGFNPDKKGHSFIALSGEQLQNFDGEWMVVPVVIKSEMDTKKDGENKK